MAKTFPVKPSQKITVNPITIAKILLFLWFILYLLLFYFY
ncbi:hypothetical protein TDIS_1888 [Thermosulfurimonas dismutans]|uniref:Uncharacterized protein n=1 Tax=Thermosulfurimonas dismutans TaxID=999894 RepID=A0A179D361_9BACT|nr:hypothetical protein TDIS_1888 [Thermosulfurimonas dismutans]